MERLTSWKEIAAYLGVTVRTAQLWERDRGLPVQRLPGGRSQVSAVVEELERWRRGANEKPEPAAGAPEVPAAHPASVALRRPLVAWAAAAAALLLVAAAVLTWFFWRPAGPPALYQVKNDVLVVTDAAGRELWHHRFHYEIHNHLPTAYKRFRTADFDGDGRLEVLFIAQPEETRTRNAALHCFSSDGRLLWSFSAAARVRTADEHFDGPFAMSDVIVAIVRGERLAVVTAHDNMWYPFRATLLSSDGKVRGEYWHSGRLTEIAAADLDGNGVDEIYMAGVNNARKQGTLIALDADRFLGASPESNPRYHFQNLPRAQERARIFFPRTDINLATSPYNPVSEMAVSPEGIVVGTVEFRAGDRVAADLFWDFHPSLRLRAASAVDDYEKKHRELESNGTLDHPWNEAELRRMQRVEYFVAPPAVQASR